jgi:hypothetical protein
VAGEQADERDDLELAGGQSARQPGAASEPLADRYSPANTFLSNSTMLYEHRFEAPLSMPRFVLRMIRHAGAATLIIVGSLLLGMWGYHSFAQEAWIDAFVNATMLLGGMGQVGDVTTTSGKLFSGFYSLYSGMVFLVLIATMLTPVIHRVLHRFHWEADQKRNTGSRRKLD